MVAQRNCSFFFFNDTATTEIYTLSLHDALPISFGTVNWVRNLRAAGEATLTRGRRTETVSARELTVSVRRPRDRKSTRLNSSHSQISYAVFCLKKKKTL